MIICAVCGTEFSSPREGMTYNAPKYCSKKCKDAGWKLNNPEKVKEARRRTHLNHREKDLANNRRWWRKNRKKLKVARQEYQRAHRKECREYSRKHYGKHKVRERNRAYRNYYLGHKPKGEPGWLRRAKTEFRNVQRFIQTGKTPEACVSQRIRSEPGSNSPT